MSVPVRLEDLGAELDRRGHAALLVTVRDDGRPHCVAVSLAWRGEELVARAGRTSVHNAQLRPAVTLVSPTPPGEGPAGLLEGYTLIVDAQATGPFDVDGAVTMRPTHAVLHRPAASPDAGHAHDCVHLLDQADA